MNPANGDPATTTCGRVRDPLVMPFSNVRHLGFRDKIRAVKLAGFGQLSLHPHETRDTIKEGLRPEDMFEIAAENDVAITRLDPLSNWNPRWLPTNMDASYIDGFDIEAAEFFELCEQLGITYCSLNATFAEDIYTTDEVVEHFASTCDLAARYDVTCDLENLPMWGVKTLRQAWSIVSAADRPNGGIVFDTLHYVRSGSTLDMLKEIPGDRVHCVQLNDGPLRLPAGVTLEENCFDRSWPGAGQFPLVEIVRTLADMNALRQVSPEVFWPHNVTRSAAEIAALSSESLRLLATALPPSQGQVSVLGLDPEVPAERTGIRRQLGYQPQEVGFPRGFTAFAFVDYIALLKEWTQPTARHTEVRRVLDLVGLSDLGSKRIRAMSGGQRRRVSLAQALLGSPPVLILDEPTTGVDPEQRVTLRTVLAEIARTSVVVLSTHQTEDVAALCERVIVLDAGRVRYDGPVTDLTGQAAGRVWLADEPDPAASISWRTGTGRYRNVGTRPPDDAEHVEPSLEDAYLLLRGGSPEHQPAGEAPS